MKHKRYGAVLQQGRDTGYGTQLPPVTGPPVSDDFNRVDSVNNMGVTPVGAKTWGYGNLNTFGIIGHRAYNSARGGGIRACCVDVGSVYGTVTAIFPDGVPGANGSGIAMRVGPNYQSGIGANAQDGILLIIGQAGANKELLTNTHGGGGSTLFNSANVPAIPCTLTLSVQKSGATDVHIVATINGISVYDQVIPGADANIGQNNTTATNVGLYLGDDVTQSANDRASFFSWSP